MRPTLRTAAVVASVALSLAPAAGSQADPSVPTVPVSTTADCPGVLIPMYGGHIGAWRHLTASPPRGAIAIANLGNGPGRVRDPQAIDVISRARAAGVRVVGYVYTQFGSRRLAQVKRDVDRWERWYPVDGIFVDNGTDSATKLAYYTSLLSHIQTAPRHLLVMNGGLRQEYMPFADVVVSFEGTFQNFQRYHEPDWVGSFPASKFATIVHGVPGRSGMRSVLDAARKRNYGTIYVTSTPYPHPYFALSPLLGSQETYLERDRGCARPPAPTG